MDDKLKAILDNVPMLLAMIGGGTDEEEAIRKLVDAYGVHSPIVQCAARIYLLKKRGEQIQHDISRLAPGMRRASSVSDTPHSILPPPRPPVQLAQKALTVDASLRHGIRVHMQYPEYLDQHGHDRFFGILAEAITKLERAAEMSDPASLNFLPSEPPRDAPR